MNSLVFKNLCGHRKLSVQKSGNLKSTVNLFLQLTLHNLMTAGFFLRKIKKSDDLKSKQIDPKMYFVGAVHK
jgi:hypothetical protein